MTRSFYRIPRAAWLDKDGNKAFGNVVVYDQTAQNLFVIAAEEDRPDLARVGTLLGKAVRELTTTNQARFLRVDVDRDGVRIQVKAADKRPTDVEVRTEVPAVIWMGDDPADYLP